ncbi:MAG: hypothetical protein HY370_05915 [Proteobacteria bacterium]|nr:hypothetical protein [Pseudomonadota bacterium]
MGKIKPKQKQEDGDSSAKSDVAPAARPKPGIADYITGEAKTFKANLYPYLPGDLVGGSVPHVPGTEIEAVWNAAAQACGTERVHFCFSVDQGRCWYLACPSASLASNPDSWCPLAAALPGNSEHWDRETVYLYEQEGQASALRWDPETGRMQVYLGAARTLLPRIQSMDANFVTVNPEMATTVPWHNRALNTEKLSRATAVMLLYIGIAINLIAGLFILYQFTSIGFIKRDLVSAHSATEKASTDLMINAYNALQSDTIKHMVRVQELLDALQKIDGTLVKYSIDKGKISWEALVPPSFSNCDGALAGCQIVPGLEKDGRVRIKGTR